MRAGARRPGSSARLALGSGIACALLALLPASSALARETLDPGPKVAPGVFLAEAPQPGVAKKREAPRSENRIVGGSATTIAEWPWQVAITANPAFFAGDGFDRQFCGGSLVAPNIVITAAHCTFEVFGSNGFDDPSNFASITGRTTLSSSEGQEIAWSNYFVFVDASGNPMFTGDVTDGWDAVFAQLASPSPSSNSSPVMIAGATEAAAWTLDDTNNERGWATGWGTTSSGGPSQDTLREVNIDMISDSTCGSAPVYGGAFNSETMVCAGEIAGGQDTCQGDSGGPLVADADPTAGTTFRLVGDTSWGIGCADANKPGVYGRVAQSPMCAALQTGIQQVAGVDVVGPGGCLAGTGASAGCAVPVGSVGTPCSPGGGGGGAAPPDTTITKRPKNKTKKKKATFEFVSSVPGSSFACAVDGQALKVPCTSPFKVKVKKGRHTFQVRATDPAGNADPTPASDSWKRKKKKKKR